MKFTLTIYIILQVFFLSPFSHATSGSKILFVRYGDETFSEVFQLMKKDLKSNNDVADFVINKQTPFSEFKSKVLSESPRLLVLMDNQATQFAINYNKSSPPSGKLKGVALMGLNLRYLLKRNTEITGIAFESPAYNLITQFRFIVDRPVKNVLVFYRPSLYGEEIELSRSQLKTEGINLEAINVEQDGSNKEKILEFLSQRLKTEAQHQDKYDCVWVMLDSGILTKQIFQTSWLPASRTSKIPFLTGIESFVSKDMNFATFAVTPNLPDLANQAVQMVEAVLSQEISLKDMAVENLVSVNKILNMKKAQDLGIKLKSDRLSEIKIIK